MTRDVLENVIMEAIADEVIKRVRERIMQLQKNALVVCTGSALSFPTWIASLQRLQQQGFQYDLFLSESALRVLDVDAICKDLMFGRVWQNDPNAEAIAGKYPTMIVPALTINTASKVSACIADTPASRAILTSIMTGKNVVISVDGCCPDNEDRKDKGYVFTPALREKLRSNIEQMRAFGATLATAATLDERTLSAIGRIGWAGGAEEPPKPKTQHSCAGKIISRQIVAAVPNGGTLRIPQGSQITQLAADTAKTRGITLIQE